MEEWFNHIEQQYGIQPCDRPGGDNKAYRQALINRSAAVAAEYEQAREFMNGSSYLQGDAWEALTRNYEDELCRIERELDELP